MSYVTTVTRHDKHNLQRRWSHRSIHSTVKFDSFATYRRRTEGGAGRGGGIESEDGEREEGGGKCSYTAPLSNDQASIDGVEQF